MTPHVRHVCVCVSLSLLHATSASYASDLRHGCATLVSHACHEGASMCRGIDRFDQLDGWISLQNELDMNLDLICSLTTEP